LFFSFLFFFSSRRRHTRFSRDWSSDVCSSDLKSLCTGAAFSAAATCLPASCCLPYWPWCYQNCFHQFLGESGGALSALNVGGDEIGRASCRERVWRCEVAG